MSTKLIVAMEHSALKVLKCGCEEHEDDAGHLNEWQTVNGIPRVLKCITKSIFAVEPVGKVFEAGLVGQLISG